MTIAHALFFRKIFESSSIGMTVCDASGQCIEANHAICEIVGATREQVLSQNFNQIESWRESGLSEVATAAAASSHPKQIKVTLTSTFGKELTANVSVSPFFIESESYLLITFDDLSELQKVQDQREELIADLRLAASEIERLKSILPLCSFCKKIQNEQGEWEHVDIYLHDHLSTDVSHGVCPECSKEHYPDFDGSTAPDKSKA